MLREPENATDMSDGEATGGSGEYATDAGVQRDGPDECCALAASELLDRDLFVRMTRRPYSKFFPWYPCGGKLSLCCF